MQQAAKIGYHVQVSTDYETTLARTIEALKAEGFGVLTEIDVKETMKKKLGVDVGAYKILGACNPPLAFRALSAAPEVGLLLPCNVTVRVLESGAVEVGLVDPLAMMALVDNAELAAVAQEAGARLERVALALQG